MQGTTLRALFCLLTALFISAMPVLGADADPLSAAKRNLAAKDTVTRRQAVETLARSESPEAGPALIGMLKDKDAYVRTLALRGLAQLRFAPAVGPIVEVVDTEKLSDVRQSAVMALGVLRGPAALASLEKALSADASEFVRVAAANALGAIGDPRSIAALGKAAEDPSVSVRRSVTAALTRMPPVLAKEALEPLLVDEDPMVRQIARQNLKENAQKKQK